MAKPLDPATKTAGIFAGVGCLGFIAFVVAMFVVAAANDEKTQAAPFDASHAVKVDADKLYTDFHENEIDAKNHYGGQSFILTGRVVEIESGSPATVTLAVLSQTDHVKALVSDEQKAAPLRPGDQVEFHCVGATLAIGDVIANACNSVAKVPDQQ